MHYAPLIGRILFSAAFLMFGVGHFMDAEMMAGMVPGFLPAKTFIVYLTGIVLVAGGLSVLLGYRAKQGALLLFVFLLLTAFFVHASGFAAGDQMATSMFMKDLALAGGALLIAHFGSGPMSLDSRGKE